MDLHRSIEAAKVLRQQIAEIVAAPDEEFDERAAQDTFDGETTLDAALRDALVAEDEDLILVDGIKKRQEELTERRRRAEDRIDRRRGLIEQAMVLAGWTKHPTELGTIILGKAQPRVEVDDEALIPSQFFKPPKPADPTLDKAGLKSVLAERQKAIDAANNIVDEAARDTRLAEIDREHPPIPGAHLEVGGHTLSVRRK